LHSVRELPHVLDLAALVDREHRRDVLDRLERLHRLAADAPGGAVGMREIEFLLEVAQSGKERVVRSVGDQRLTLDVVSAVVLADGLPEQFDLSLGFDLREILDRGEVRRRLSEIWVVFVRVFVGDWHSCSRVAVRTR